MPEHRSCHPPKYSRFLGFISKKIAADRSLFDNYDYLGWIIIALAIMAIILALLRKNDKGEDQSANDVGHDSSTLEGPLFKESWKPFLWGLVFAAIVAFVLSLRPYFHLGDAKIYLPSIVLRYIVPWLRWFNRLGVISIICLIVLACLSVAWLMRRLPQIGVLVVIVLMMLLFIEMTLVPPFRYFKTDDVPLVYRSISRMPDSTALVFYPAFEPGFFNAQQYLFYQRTFQKPILNGPLDNTDGEALRRTVYNPFNPQVPSILSRYGFTDIVFLGKMFESYEGTDEAGGETRYLPAEFELRKRYPSSDPFADAYIYKINAPKATFVPIYQGDISVPHIYKGQRMTVRLMDREGIIRIVSYAKETVRARIIIPVNNMQYDHRLTISQGGKVLWERLLSDNEAGEAVVLFSVPSGGTELHLKAEGKQWKLAPAERFLFGFQTATMRMGDVIVEPL